MSAGCSLLRMGSIEHGNKSASYIKRCKFFDQQSNYQLFSQGSALWILLSFTDISVPDCNKQSSLCLPVNSELETF